MFQINIWEIDFADLDRVQQFQSCQKMMTNLGYVHVQVKTDKNTTVIREIPFAANKTSI